jgi:hypothetical protein
MRLAAAATLLIAVATLAVAGCGEKHFSASGFIDAANEQGAELDLGERLATNPAGEEVYPITTAASGGEPNPQLEGSGSKGTMIVADDAGSAGDEFDRCDQSADLTCFRAANVVLRFEGMDAADRARISGAVSALASDG